MRIPSRWARALRSCFGEPVALEDTVYFDSKKNQVSLLLLKERAVIGKMFCWGDPEKEERILRRASEKGLHVPRILGRYRSILFLEYIKGRNLRVLRDEPGFPDVIRELARWLALFHEAFRRGKKTSLLKGDMRLQNFIQSGDRIYGVDFEESEAGPPVRDVADMAATLLGIDGFKSGQNLDVFIESYGEHSRFDLSGLEAHLGEIKERRARLAELRQ